MDRPLSFNEDDEDKIEKCETWEQVIKVIEKKEQSRKKQPEEYYEGRRAFRKKCFFVT
jgi:hypothetical protein